MKEKSSQSTILIISTGFLLLFLLFSMKWMVFVSIFVGLIGIFSEYLSQKVEQIWVGISKILGYIIPNILLTFIFFVILTPLSFIYKMFNKDALMLSINYDSYFLNKKGNLKKENFEKIW